MTSGSENPFTPNFGRRPALLVGREPLLQSIETSLSHGSSDYGFARLLLGQRGSGKTTILSEVSERAAANGALVLNLDAATVGLLDRISSAVTEAKTQYDMDDTGRTRLSGVTVGPIGVSWQDQNTQQPQLGVAQQLEELTSLAAQQGSLVLLTVDEMHAGDREELRRLCADIQRISNIRELPLAFVGAGLPEMAYTVLEDKKMTFFHRCYRDEVPTIAHVDAWRCLRQTIQEANGTIAQDALRVMADEAADGLAYKLQSIGHHAWNLAGAPENPIDLPSANMALELASKDTLAKVIIPMWHDLAESDQEYLIAVSQNGAPAPPSAIATQLRNKSARALARSERRLSAAGHVRRTEDGHMIFSGALTASAVNNIVAREAAYRRDTDSDYRIGFSSVDDVSQTRVVRCQEYMPRAKANCVLPRGHQGPHRSKRW